MKINQLSWTSLQSHMPWDFSKQIPDQASVCSPCDCAFCLVPPLTIPRFTIAQPAAMTAANLYIPKQFSLVCKREV